MLNKTLAYNFKQTQLLNLVRIAIYGGHFMLQASIFLSKIHMHPTDLRSIGTLNATVINLLV